MLLAPLLEQTQEVAVLAVGEGVLGVPVEGALHQEPVFNAVVCVDIGD